MIQSRQLCSTDVIESLLVTIDINLSGILSQNFAGIQGTESDPTKEGG